MPNSLRQRFSGRTFRAPQFEAWGCSAWFSARGVMLASWLGTRTALHQVLHEHKFYCSPRWLNAYGKRYSYAGFHFVLWEWVSIISVDLFSAEQMLNSHCHLPPNIALVWTGGRQTSCFVKLCQRHQALLTRIQRKTPEHLVPIKDFTSILVLNNLDLLSQLPIFKTFSLLGDLGSGYKCMMRV